MFFDSKAENLSNYIKRPLPGIFSPCYETGNPLPYFTGEMPCNRVLIQKKGSLLSFRKDFNNHAIAVLLNISEATVYRHLANIRKKFGIHKSYQIILHRINECEGHSMLKLTPRGREVFNLCLAGHSTKEIYLMLNIGISGVRRHKEKMLLANGCESMRQLISLYYMGRISNHERGNVNGHILHDRVKAV